MGGPGNPLISANPLQTITCNKVESFSRLFGPQGFGETTNAVTLDYVLAGLGQLQIDDFIPCTLDRSGKALKNRDLKKIGGFRRDEDCSVKKDP